MAKVLLVGLGSNTNDELARVLEANDHTIVTAEEPPDAIFCGADVGRVVHANRSVPVIVVTGESATAKRLDAMDHGAADYCSEPVEESEILWTLSTALQALR